MTSLLHRPITAVSDDGVCRWHAAKLWQTRVKLLKLNLTCITSFTTTKNILKYGLLILKNLTLKTWVQPERGQIGSYWLELVFLTLLAFTALHTLRWMATPLNQIISHMHKYVTNMLQWNTNINTSWHDWNDVKNVPAAWEKCCFIQLRSLRNLWPPKLPKTCHTMNIKFTTPQERCS